MHKFSTLMKTHNKKEKHGVKENGISFHFLINTMIAHLNDTIHDNRIRIENNVSPSIRVYFEQDKMNEVIYEMIATVISNARHTTISITAEKFNDITIVSIEDSNNFNGYALSFALISIETQARMAGANLSVRDVQKKVATVSLSFLDVSKTRTVIYS